MPSCAVCSANLASLLRPAWISLRAQDRGRHVDGAAPLAGLADLFPELLKGRALNVVADHSPEAEQLLSKAVKLEPNLVDAWIELGECYWKRGDVETAKTCFEGALSHVST